MVQRVVYRRRCKYNTASNKTKRIKTPGGRVLLQKALKTSGKPKCGDCKKVLPGIAAARPHIYKTLKKRQRTVSRAYGGARCHSCVKDRIIRAFLKEEQKSLKKAVREKKAPAAPVEKAPVKKPEPEKRSKTEKKKSSGAKK
ncbi:bifunctional Ribosomal protein L34e [Babesia duncani]|uniref:Bifunctional Ribosomal protein L34e n=1 Tax=Babesia duncani TaxID=323732 RepID=A0AAD9UNX7_9APIC|nr:bifunctional Ribosomal protein L34e [Babesia duncani]